MVTARRHLIHVFNRSGQEADASVDVEAPVVAVTRAVVRRTTVLPRAAMAAVVVASADTGRRAVAVAVVSVVVAAAAEAASAVVAVAAVAAPVVVVAVAVAAVAALAVADSYHKKGDSTFF